MALGIARLGTIDAVDWLEPAAKAPANALVLVGNLQVMVALAGLIDMDAERARLEKEEKRLQGKLGNAASSAPHNQ